MLVKLLGTAAKEGIPAVFCGCETCRAAAKLGGKNIRRRSGTLIDGNILLDMSDDIFMHKLNYNLELYKISAIVYTHSHGDHFSPFALTDLIQPIYCKRDVGRVNIYGNKAIQKEYYANGFGAHFLQMGFTAVRDGRSFKIDDKTFTPIRTTHSDVEDCMLYLIEQGEKRLFFGHDSPVYNEHVYNALKNKRLDVAILDCCHALGAPRLRHMNLAQCVKVKERMLASGIADQNTRFIITHFTHNAHALHEEIEAEAGKRGIEVAFDGMELEV